MAANIPVKRYFSTMAGAPVVNGIAGSVVTLLDAVLVNGFNSKTPTDLSHAAGVATAVCAGHGYEAGDVVALGGANEAAWNGEFRVVSATTNNFTFAIEPTAPASATGTFAARIAPLGWEKVYSGTQKAAYRPPLPYARNLLRVLDDSTVPTSASGRWAKLRGYESMTDIDNGTGPFPSGGNGLSLNKSSTSDATARAWWIIGDAGIFYMGVFWNPAYLTAASVTAFGDTGSLRVGDAYCTLLVGTELDTMPSNPGASNNFTVLGGFSVSQTGKYYARSHTQLGGAVAAGMIGDNGVSLSLGGSAALAYPHPSNNGLMLATVSTCENSAIRCKALPGLYQVLHNTPFNYRDVVTDFPDLPGRTLIALDMANSSGGRAQSMFDATGPWK